MPILRALTFFAAQLLQKQIGILHDLAPKAMVIGVLVNPNNPRHQADLREVQMAARRLGVQVSAATAGGKRDFEPAFALLAQHGVRALIVAGDAFFTLQRQDIVALAIQHAIPAMYNLRDYVEADGLVSYGARVVADAYYQAGVYAARIVKGERPGDLPVIQSTKFELIINVKAAKAIGLEVPLHLQQLADEVIE